VQEALKETDIVIIVTGSIEQHGPQNPLGTDSISIYEIAKRAVKQLETEGIKVVMGPLIPFGISPHHMAFPGTISLKPSTFKALVFDVGECLIRHGFQNVILLNGHGGNAHEVAMAALELAEKTEANVHFLIPRPKPIEGYVSGDHGGLAETSRNLAIVPKLVNMKKATNNQNPEYDKIFAGYPTNPADYLSLTVKRWAEITNQLGFRGNAASATPELGEESINRSVRVICNYIKNHFILKIKQ
ncbi:MAG: creatininase family protein, partial [Candidatus Hodarchaeota archaeon]